MSAMKRCFRYIEANILISVRLSGTLFLFFLPALISVLQTLSDGLNRARTIHFRYLPHLHVFEF